MMMVISPIMIIWISLQASSALGLNWSSSALFFEFKTLFVIFFSYMIFFYSIFIIVFLH
ncbi:YidC/Oxa1 family membrane protein insertase, partial [Staphylococcus epidermidis]|nr:YidC/Oxa1 family membrane protein insertase [Staphylococcus epidermidis]